MSDTYKSYPMMASITDGELHVWNLVGHDELGEVHDPVARMVVHKGELGTTNTWLNKDSMLQMDRRWIHSVIIDRHADAPDKIHVHYVHNCLTPHLNGTDTFEGALTFWEGFIEPETCQKTGD